MLAQNHDNVSEWNDMSARGMLFQQASTIKIQLSVLVQCKDDIIIIIVLNESGSRHGMADTIAHLMSNNNSTDYDYPFDIFKLFF